LRLSFGMGLSQFVCLLLTPIASVLIAADVF
jgi:hypothetical protein